MRGAGGCDRPRQRIVQAAIARMGEIEDRDVGERAGRDDTDVGKAEHAGAARARPAHDVLDAHGGRALYRTMHVPGAVHLADHVGGFVRCGAVDRERSRSPTHR